MRIGVDIDGVLNYREEFVLAYGTKYCVESGHGKLTDVTSHSLKQVFGWTLEQRDEFWYRYGKYQMWVWPAQCFAADVIHKLREEGNEIYIVTGRNERDDPAMDGMPEGKSWEEITKSWLAENGIEYDGFGFDLGRPAPNDKGTYCAEHGIDVMIEDNPDYLGTLEGKTKIFIYNQPYNQAVELENSERVYSWYDIYAKLKEMK